MIIEGVLLLAMWPFHQKKQETPQHKAAVNALIKASMEVIVADGDIVAGIESKSPSATLLVEADLIQEAKQDIQKCMNEHALTKFEDDVDALNAVVDKLLAVDQELRDEIVL